MTNIIINLADNKDSSITIDTLPTWKCKVLFELNPIELSINFYINGQIHPVYKSILIYASRLNPYTDIGPMENSNRYWSYIGDSPYNNYTCNPFKPLIEAMEKNISFGSTLIVFKWCAPNNIFRYTNYGWNNCRNVMTINNFVLCDDSKNQFISEFKYLSEILALMFFKMRICDDLRT